MKARMNTPAGSSYRRVVFSAATILWVAAALVGCGGGSDSPTEDPAPPPAVPVHVGQISERLFRPGVPASGQWIASNELVVAAPFGALVDSLGPQQGDRLSRREVIAWLTTRESQAAVEGAEILLMQAGDAVAREEASRALTLARRDLVRVPLTAPAPGTVLRRVVEPGAVVAVGSEIYAIVSDGAIVFEAHVPFADAGRLTVGQKARVTSEGGAAIDARVRRFLPSAGAADQSALVWLSPQGAVPIGSLGRFGTAFIETGAPRRAVGVPDSALVEDDLTGEVRVALVDSSGIAVWTPLKVGAEQDGWREILEPMLRSGSVVVIRGQHGLPDSTRVIAAP